MKYTYTLAQSLLCCYEKMPTGCIKYLGNEVIKYALKATYYIYIMLKVDDKIYVKKNV